MPGSLQYAYRDSSSRDTTVLSVTAGRSLNCSECALGKTLQQLHEQKQGLAHMLWNTEFPDAYPASTDCSADCAYNTGGHSKGVVASSASKGFWLIHSVPKFPDISTGAFSWEAGVVYGQNLMCLTVSASDIETIAKNLQYTHVHTYAWGVPSTLNPLFPNLRDTAGGRRMSGTGAARFSVGRWQFRSYFKSPSWNSDLYETIVQPDLAAAGGM